jgi:hypothetical protein
MRKIIVGFSRPKTFKIGAELIKFYINRPYSHVYMRYTDDQARDLVWHAAHGTVHPVLFENFEKDNETVKEYIFYFSEEEYQNFRDIFYTKSGSLYSYRSLIMIPLHDLAWKLGFYFKNEDDQGYICSEIVSYTFNITKNITFSKPYNLVQPSEVDEAFEAWFNKPS